MTTPQQAYAARPFAARVETSHFSGTFRFDTEAEAIDYLHQQFAWVKRVIRNREYGNAWVNFDCQRSVLQRPDGQVIPAKYVLLADNLSSH